jgi:hypothetical protein
MMPLFLGPLTGVLAYAIEQRVAIEEARAGLRAVAVLLGEDVEAVMAWAEGLGVEHREKARTTWASYEPGSGLIEARRRLLRGERPKGRTKGRTMTMTTQITPAGNLAGTASLAVLFDSAHVPADACRSAATITLAPPPPPGDPLHGRVVLCSREPGHRGDHELTNLMTWPRERGDTCAPGAPPPPPPPEGWEGWVMKAG